MGKSIERRAGQAFAAEYFRPIREGKIRGDDETQAFIGHADHVEQQLRAKFTRTWQKQCEL